jgi:hypothetical protein
VPNASQLLVVSFPLLRYCSEHLDDDVERDEDGDRAAPVVRLVSNCMMRRVG